MKKILLYIILFLSGIDGAWALPIEKEGMSIYSPSLKQEVSYAIILPEGYEHSDTEYPVLYMFHGIGGDYTSWLEYGNVARVMDKMIKEGKIQPFIMVIPDGYLSYYSDTYDGSSLYETFFIKELVTTWMGLSDYLINTVNRYSSLPNLLFLLARTPSWSCFSFISFLLFR